MGQYISYVKTPVAGTSIVPVSEVAVTPEAVSEATPITEATPATEATPITEATSATEATPATEATSATEATPATEATSATEATVAKPEEGRTIDIPLDNATDANKKKKKRKH